MAALFRGARTITGLSVRSARLMSSGPSWANPVDTFARRHTDASTADRAAMCALIGVKDLGDLINKTVPNSIRLHDKFNFPASLTESELYAAMKALGAKNTVFRSYQGEGFANTWTPNVIRRCILENPGWYTQYTPYQAEIAQGRLESLVNFQTMICEMTGLDIANASLLDEPCAAAEAMAMTFTTHNRKRTVLFVDENTHQSTISVVKGRASPLGITVVVGDVNKADFSKKDTMAVLLSYPNTFGALNNFSDVSARAHKDGTFVICATDLLALTKIKSPAEQGADIAVGNSQRFGIPLGYGGPHAAFIAATEEFSRKLPGRLVGISKDPAGNKAYRLSLQTRETHIRRGKATSNICTAQALLANMAAMFAIYHGPKGLKDIADRVHHLTTALAQVVVSAGHSVPASYFDTLKISLKGTTAAAISAKALNLKINIRTIDAQTVGIALDETVSLKDLADLASLFQTQPLKLSSSPVDLITGSVHARETKYLQGEIFNSLHTEHGLMRYIKSLENKDISMVHAMIPLGSCTMKLNSATEMQALTWPEFSNIHPFAPADQTKGYHEMFKEVHDMLCTISGYDAVCMQPNSGAQGEFAGLRTIAEYHASRGDGHRNICVIPVSAHGTNPASAAMAGMTIVDVKTTKDGAIDVADFRKQCETHKNNLSCCMITYPSTRGVFEENVREICEITHANGGQVYLDGANMNAQSLLCRPGDYGADVSHFNLHKTFCIPHGGGGPGMGPIGVKKHLAPFVPSHPLIDPKGQPAVSGGPNGSSLIVTISWAYMRMMGWKGIEEATSVAILNANYMAARLAPHFPIMYRGAQGMVAHEFVVDFNGFKATSGVEVSDVAKRLMDYGYHAPTMSWPVPGALMVEPTESETKAELDRYCDALISIRQEIQEIEDGVYPRDSNVLKHAPHTLMSLMEPDWKRPYSQEKAGYPLPWLKNRKMWPTVGRVDDVYGDKNLITRNQS